eukprot:TRINITY_DN11556_c0_g1_i1.p1 TRINITY_DN11556_c0_g1~~TRINITY_DN11556_c0_g1_i1.p1  ORF type:complete len:366 (+),score=63.14 TRINITY_DN11556_c0_g1_i1:14-1111(+)
MLGTMVPDMRIKFPKSKLNYIRGVFGNNQNDLVYRVINHHWFNYQLDIFTTKPNINTDYPDTIIAELPPQWFFLVHIELHQLLEPTFIEQYIHNGNLVAISMDGHIDSDNVVAIANKQLYFSMNKDTYQRFGIQARKSKFRTGVERWVSTIDLSAKSFVPGKKLYDRLQWCLQDRATSTKMLIMWTNNEGNCGDIQFPGGCISTKYQLNFSDYEMEIGVPRFDSNEIYDAELYYQDIFDWIGVVSQNIQSFFPSIDNDDEDEFVSTFQNYELEIDDGLASIKKWSGLISNNFINSILTNIRNQVNDGKISTGVISLTGFEDAPVSWKNCEHSYSLNNGDHGYSIVVLPNNEYILYTFTNCYDQYM